MIEPVGYREMLTLQRRARVVLTDSGGVQKEAYWLGVPCITLRDETEWVETVAAGWNRLAGADRQTILKAADEAVPQVTRPDLYGDGTAGEKIVSLLRSGGE
jgi:UDP-N-acetylglucosamine 2-epimerase